ncbi:hypothetical protein M885DRAFT_521885 [Pelagophyceae sp. CCMP2097]|nr:hypothetical protein M885DRAFT_521885 [Pelagophyceae sp. CCMP2097]
MRPAKFRRASVSSKRAPTDLSFLEILEKRCPWNSMVEYKPQRFYDPFNDWQQRSDDKAERMELDDGQLTCKFWDRWSLNTFGAEAYDQKPGLISEPVANLVKTQKRRASTLLHNERRDVKAMVLRTIVLAWNVWARESVEERILAGGHAVERTVEASVSAVAMQSSPRPFFVAVGVNTCEDFEEIVRLERERRKTVAGRPAYTWATAAQLCRLEDNHMLRPELQPEVNEPRRRHTSRAETHVDARHWRTGDFADEDTGSLVSSLCELALAPSSPPSAASPGDSATHGDAMPDDGTRSFVPRRPPRAPPAPGFSSRAPHRRSRGDRGLPQSRAEPGVPPRIIPMRLHDAMRRADPALARLFSDGADGVRFLVAQKSARNALPKLPWLAVKVEARAKLQPFQEPWAA